MHHACTYTLYLAYLSLACFFLPTCTSLSLYQLENCFVPCSCLKSIRLLCVVKHDTIMKYSVEKVMEPIVESVLQLEKVGCTL